MVAWQEVYHQDARGPRPDSPTCNKWHAAGFSAKNHAMLYVRKGFAHGFQTLEDDAEVFYMMGEYYYKESARGMRWDEREIGIEWPVPQTIISSKDLSFDKQ